MVNSVITTARHGDVLVITSDNPPVNALGQAVRAGLAAALLEASADPAIRAIVLRCAGRTFFAGADMTEFESPAADPPLAAVVDALESSAKPVVAAIHGTALGGGLEVALGCHYRIAAVGARLGLPDVKLGLLPGAGGTQRLPRLIGVEAALEMIAGGDPIAADRALDLGLIDAVAGGGDLEAEAIAVAQAAGDRARHPTARSRTDRIAEAVRDPAVFDRFRRTHARRFRGFEAPEACIQAVKAAVDLPFDEGVAREGELFRKLVTGGQSRTLRYVFCAERAAARIDDLPAATAAAAVSSVGVLGAGTMGGGIAMNFLSAGLPVTIVEREPAALERGVAIIRANYEASAKKGRISARQVEEAMARLTPTLDYADLAGCDLIIEAVFENMDLKKEVFARLDATAKPDAILATNTSYLNVDEIAAATRRPQSVIGLHFFSPANVMRLLEIVRGARTSGPVLQTSMEIARRIGKIAVVAGVCPGFIGNRMLTQRQRAAQDLILEGAKPWDVDRVLVSFGFPMGPYQMSDLAGLDIGWSRATSKGETIRDVLCERGRRGQKTGRGFYDYDENRRSTPSPEVEEIIAAFVCKSGRAQRILSDQEILERMLFPMVNEGAMILEERIAQRASDIDVVWLNGYGWPAFTGGPMFWADTIGVARVVAGLEAVGQTPASLLREAAASGRRLAHA